MKGSQYKLERDKSWDLFKPAYTKDDVMWRDNHAFSAACDFAFFPIIMGAATLTALSKHGYDSGTKILLAATLSTGAFAGTAYLAHKLVRKEVTEDLDRISKKDTILEESAFSFNYLMKSLS